MAEINGENGLLKNGIYNNGSWGIYMSNGWKGI